MSGVFLVNDRLPVSLAIEELLLTSDCTEMSDWFGRVVHLPL